MNYKTLFTILLICVCLTSPAMAAGQFFESKIVPTEPYTSVGYGTLYGSIRCGYNTLTKEVGIKNNLDLNGSYKFFPIRPDGTFEEILIPGTFALYLPDGNGGQPEYSSVTIRANERSYPERELLGHGITQDGREESITPELTSDCHTHSIWIIGHFEYYNQKPHWRWEPGRWYTWTCCRHHCNNQG
jgi:hypothetical protein